MDLTNYHSALPYPPVKAQTKNPAYAQAMLSNVGGSNSEMSAVSLYFYNHLVTPEWQDVADAFMHISVVEMHHLEIFGTLARQLGLDPRLWERRDQRMIYWTPGYNSYPQDLLPLLQNALKGEKMAIAKYQSQAEEIQDANIVENLRRILLDEQMHVEIFEALIKKYS